MVSRQLCLLAFLLIVGLAFASKADQKCDEYSDLIRKTVDGPTKSAADYPPNPQVAGLGKVSTTPGEFPHMAQLGYLDKGKLSWNCAGVLISDEYVLTVAQCARTPIFDTVSSIRLGVYDVRNTESDSNIQTYGISEIITHPDYKPNSKYNDIALIKLDKKVQFTKYVLPACLQTKTDLGTDTVIATGYGAVERLGEVSNQLLKVLMELFTNEECKTQYNTSRTLSKGISDEMLCSGGRTESKSTCQGDSGGPIQIYKSKNPNIYSVAGLISFGKSCGIAGFPEVATRVSSYVPWIESIVWS